jgi:hypothetical protein
MDFRERSYKLLADQVRAGLPSGWGTELNVLLPWLADHQVEQKRADAIGCLRHLASIPKSPEIPTKCIWQFRMTESWSSDLQSSGRLVPGIKPPVRSNGSA